MKFVITYNLNNLGEKVLPSYSYIIIKIARGYYSDNSSVCRSALDSGTSHAAYGLADTYAP